MGLKLDQNHKKRKAHAQTECCSQQVWADTVREARGLNLLIIFV